MSQLGLLTILQPLNLRGKVKDDATGNSVAATENKVSSCNSKLEVIIVICVRLLRSFFSFSGIVS